MYLVFTPSVALLSSFRQSFKKLLRFYLLEPKGPANFECPILKLHTLNYHTEECFKILIIFLKTKVLHNILNF